MSLIFISEIFLLFAFAKRLKMYFYSAFSEVDMRSLNTVAVSVLMASALTASASATTLSDPTTGTCTGTHCSSIVTTVNLGKRGTTVLPWVAELYKPANACLRVTLSGMSTSLNYRLYMIAPDASYWTYTGNNGFDLGAEATRGAGFYVLRISAETSAGAATDTTATLSFGVYASGNPNCNVTS